MTYEGDVYCPSRGIGAADVENLMSWLRSNVQVQQFGMRYSAEDVVAYDLMNKACTQVEGHFQLPFLWRNDTVILPESFEHGEEEVKCVKTTLEA